MTVRIVRRPKAAQDAEGIADYIAESSLKAAVRFLENTESTIEKLAESPGVGTNFDSEQVKVGELRFRRVDGFPNHFIFFIAHNTAIEIVRILHGAVDLEQELRRTIGKS